MLILELTENEAKVIQNELWLRLHGAPNNVRLAPTGSYTMWLRSAIAKIHAALPAPQEFADNH